jgi:site-specific DNA recombinase
MLKYFMYRRKSSEDEDRQVISNESQEDELKVLVTRDKLSLIESLKEAASAKLAGTRPVFNEMVKRIKNGEANGILCWHPNRLSRNAIDAAVLVDLMDQGKLLEIRMPGQTFKNTPGDKFLLTLFCSQAKLENDNKSVDVKRGLRKKVEMRWYPGVAPTGYLNDKTKNRGERDIYNDPERFLLTKRMWQLMLTCTYTAPQVLKIANNDWGFRTRLTKKQGGTPLSLSGLYHIFHNPFYYGWFEYPRGSGEWREGKHEPMVSKAEFDKVQALLGTKHNSRPSKHLTFPFTGVIRCKECSGMITAEEKHQVICTVCRCKFSYRNRDLCLRCKIPIAQMSKPLFLHYTYYHCAQRSKTNCKQRSIKAAELEKQIQAQLGRIEISAEFKEWAFEYVQELHDKEINAMRHIAISTDKAYVDCLKRIESLVKLKTSPENNDGSLLSDEEYRAQRQKLLEEKARLAPKDIKSQANHALHRSEETFEFAHSAQSKFTQGNFQIKKQVLATIGSNLYLMDEKLIIEAKKPFVLLQASMSPDMRGNSSFEPRNTLVKQSQNRGNDNGFSSLLSARRSNLMNALSSSSNSSLRYKPGPALTPSRNGYAKLNPQGGAGRIHFGTPDGNVSPLALRRRRPRHRRSRPDLLRLAGSDQTVINPPRRLHLQGWPAIRKRSWSASFFSLAVSSSLAQ